MFTTNVPPFSQFSVDKRVSLTIHHSRDDLPGLPTKGGNYVSYPSESFNPSHAYKSTVTASSSYQRRSLFPPGRDPLNSQRVNFTGSDVHTSLFASADLIPHYTTSPSHQGEHREVFRREMLRVSESELDLTPGHSSSLSSCAPRASESSSHLLVHGTRSLRIPRDNIASFGNPSVTGRTRSSTILPHSDKGFQEKSQYQPLQYDRSQAPNRSSGILSSPSPAEETFTDSGAARALPILHIRTSLFRDDSVDRSREEHARDNVSPHDAKNVLSGTVVPHNAVLSHREKLHSIGGNDVSPSRSPKIDQRSSSIPSSSDSTSPLRMPEIPRSCSSDPNLLRKRAHPRWLIDASTLRLVEFPSDSAVPPYAILSHRWEEGQEISFQEMAQLSTDETHPSRVKSGFRKISNACKQALKDNHTYMWVDTCCIDDRDLKQKAQDINSMYDYYQHSVVCYVFLNDFTIRTSASVSISDSTWFSRGWTLQELIAPSSVKFYTADWGHYGDRSCSYLHTAIASKTGIPSSVLNGRKRIREVGIEEKMSWSIRRETTKEEDKVYCLLGLLGVTLEPRYGEGAESAFERLSAVLRECYPREMVAIKETHDGKSIMNMLLDSNAQKRHAAARNVSHEVTTP
ncbi:hypothetical protein D9758_017863 [Tetrapyrgos nigripes]|uniref:Heterokaryon incompatibility domain-containing protein n=1 Tax=Tetrapyrgos nigripes TaxID=182062 RepID=A0A8H5FE14_9AGAR|nr:hypothetical protein D9758_017863 [Tetrapyrgos nigripes]